ncbi:ArnT family glycosyltransferase [Streptacidiphilus melanogenes]|uniref:ArnT family glycosyltransferase n=1 Tax=Streptacidiphilus melanogenes TaxID=411235 RepID=UPI000AA6EB13|nr:glycosyltransferase family 39 protein [Streptacidiphilus melanogenes]
MTQATDPAATSAQASVPGPAPESSTSGRPPNGCEPFALRPVAIIAGVLTLALLATSARYGYYGDELYFLAAGKHPAWGYVDQPPLVPLLSHALDSLAPGNLVVLRLPATLLSGAGVVLCALITRELGGQRRAQLLAAGAFAVSPIVVVFGHLLITPTLDVFFWTLISWLLVRWIRLRDDKLLLWLGLAAALGLQNKYLVGVFLLALLVAVAAVGPRGLLTRPALWVAGVFTVLATTPSLLWQAQHGWPQSQMTSVIAAEDDRLFGGQALFLPLALAFAGFPLMILLCAGLWRLLRMEELRTYRFLGWAAVGTTAFFLVTDGRQYYVAGLFPVLWAAGAVSLQHRPAARGWRWAFSRVAFVISALVAVAELPLYPLGSTTGALQAVNFAAADTIGWPQLSRTVAVAYRALPADEQRRAIVVADTFWAEGALERYGPALGLPKAYSPQRGAWYFGPPPDTAAVVLYVGGDEAKLRTEFASVRQVGTVDNGYGVKNSQQGKPLWLCQGPHTPWSELWPSLRELA